MGTYIKRKYNQNIGYGMLDAEVHSYNPSYSGGRGRRITSSRLARPS
jgi:hypothetical protein